MDKTRGRVNHRSGDPGMGTEMMTTRGPPILLARVATTGRCTTLESACLGEGGGLEDSWNGTGTWYMVHGAHDYHRVPPCSSPNRSYGAAPLFHDRR